jgi:hypothetical protein
MLYTTERPGRQTADAEVLHPLITEDRSVMAAMRTQVEPFKGTMTGPEAREAYDAIMEQTPDAPGVSYERGAVGGVRGIWCRPRTADPGSVILYLHGGPTSSARRRRIGTSPARSLPGRTRSCSSPITGALQKTPFRLPWTMRGRPIADSSNREHGRSRLSGTRPAAASRLRCCPSSGPKHSLARAPARAPWSPCRLGRIWP